jgi:hypothetical protein
MYKMNHISGLPTDKIDKISSLSSVKLDKTSRALLDIQQKNPAKSTA